MKKIEPPYYPIIYIRGYAMTQSEIDATVATPYMGFNLGSTRIRQNWKGGVERHIFESPLVRLMKEYGYRDVYEHGTEKQDRIPSRSIVIHRYYEQADSELGGEKAPSVMEAARGLSELIIRIRDQVCGEDPDARSAFKVYLAAHSMGGLVCRCFLQNPEAGEDETREAVDKVFTYATPHNGIEMAGINVPGFLGKWDINNFNRGRMAEYLALEPDNGRVDSLDGKFDPNRFFCLVGTNHKDYDAGMGLSRRLAGEMSDGLVKVENATVRGAPRAFTYRSHSGPYGIVSSEEGYQNLVRFFFGNVRVDGVLDVEDVPLPPSVRKEFKRGRRVRASYYFESTVSPRGAVTFKLTERRRETYSAVLRRFDDLFRLEKTGRTTPRSPMLFSAFLDTSKITVGRGFMFSIDLSVLTTGYEMDGFLMFNRHVPGENLFRNTLAIRATPRRNGWHVRYNLTDDDWSENTGSAAREDDKGLFIPLSSKKGFKGKLRLEISPWS